MKRSLALVGVALLLLSMLQVSLVMGANGQDAEASPAARQPTGEALDVAPLDTAFHFDAEGLLSLGNATSLPMPRGAVVAHWYAFRGWAVVVFEGLDLEATGPLCLGTSAIDPDTGLIGNVAYAPTAERACDDAGAGPLPLAGPVGGVRTCSDVVAFITGFPAESRGAMVANALVFSGDGTAIGLSSRFEPSASLGELDASIVDCGALPPPRQQVVATPTPRPTPALTPAPASAGSIARADRAPAPSPVVVPECVEPAAGELQDVFTTPAGPYLVKHPTVAALTTATIIFLPGGGGGFGSAQRVWETVFARGAGFGDFRIVIPYAVDADLIDEAARTFDIVDEMLWCHGGDPMQVHLAGASNGGLAAFGLMVEQPARFATLAGAPGAFPVRDPMTVDPSIWRELLGGRAVLNGVGEFDSAWMPEVIATHNALAAAGIESVYIEFERQGHILASGFDSSVLLEFWSAHQ